MMNLPPLQLRRIVLLVTLVAASTLFTAACGEVTVEGNVNTGDEIGGSDMVDVILPELQKQAKDAGGDAGNVEIDCPAGTKKEAGTKFECAVTRDGDEIGIITGEMDGGGKFDWKYADFYRADVVADKIRDIAVERSIEADEITCPERQPIEVGRTFTCEVDGKYLEVTTDDEQGGFVLGQMLDEPIEG